MKDFENILLSTEDFKINKDYILDVNNNNIYNKKIIDYYKKLFREFECDKLNFTKLSNPICKTKISNLTNCNRFWNCDVYYQNMTKDFISTNLCHDKFCNNCKKVVQASRMSKYIPEIEPYKEKLYHLTLTIPNVNSKNLLNALNKMKKCFKKLMDIYCHNCHICSFYDFSKIGYKGAIRSLEITFKNDNYHPHYHCAFVFDNLELDKKYKNIYSTDFYKNRGDRLFSEFEIVIQKIWYMIWNNIRINKKNFDELEQGYSCICDKFYDDDYMELFKYMTKSIDENDNILTYDNFKTLYIATYRLKQIQGYGCFYHINDNNLNDEIDNIYADIKYFLETTDDKPEFKSYDLLELLNDDKFLIISRKKIYQYLKSLK